MRLDHGHRAKICAGLLALFVGAGVLLRADGAMIHTGSVAVRFYTRAILGEFVLGMLCFEIFSRTSAFRSGNRPAHSQLIWTVLGLALLVCIPLADFLAPDTDRFLRWGLLAAASFSCLMHGLGGVRLPAIVVAVGDASYSLYLFHPYVIQIFDKIFKCFAVADARAYAMSGAVIALCCGLAVLSYRMIEQPLTGRLRRLLPGEPA